MHSHMPRPRAALAAYAAQALATYLASGGKVQVGKPCLSRYKPHPPRPAIYAN